jgi:ribose transport system ATP-binding protein
MAMREPKSESLNKPILSLQRITKVFPGVVALDAVNFDVYGNEVLGLVGENGAGKSTLMRIMVGLQQPDGGEIYAADGARILLKDPDTAIRHGIGMVFQEGSLMANLSVMENLFLCHERIFSRGGFLSRRAMKETAKSVLARVSVQIDVDTLVGDVSSSARQMIEIARLLWLSTLYGQKNPVLILDEPTTVLTDSERETLFSTLKKLKQDASVVLISHRLQEIVENVDRIVILRDGHNVTEIPAAEARIADIELQMVGHTISEDRFWESDQTAPGAEIVLEVKELGRKGLFDPLSFSVRRGEIVSLVGLVGSGKEAVCRCITGQEKPDSGGMTLSGKRLPGGSPSHAVRMGIGHIPIDRRNEGLASTMTVAENVNLLVLKALSAIGFLRPLMEKRNAEHWVAECLIKTPSINMMCGNLSGGNQQKTVLAKWLSSRVKLLVLDHPTRGVDVGAKAEIYRLMRKLARDGIGILIMCDTLEEDIGLCNRMLVMKDGRMVKELQCRPNQRPSPKDIISLIV